MTFNAEPAVTQKDIQGASLDLLQKRKIAKTLKVARDTIDTQQESCRSVYPFLTFLRKLQIFISQNTDFHFVSFCFANYSKPKKRIAFPPFNLPNK